MLLKKWKFLLRQRCCDGLLHVRYVIGLSRLENKFVLAHFELYCIRIGRFIDLWKSSRKLWNESYWFLRITWTIFELTCAPILLLALANTSLIRWTLKLTVTQSLLNCTSVMTLLLQISNVLCYWSLGFSHFSNWCLSVVKWDFGHTSWFRH